MNTFSTQTEKRGLATVLTGLFPMRTGSDFMHRRLRFVSDEWNLLTVLWQLKLPLIVMIRPCLHRKPKKLQRVAPQQWHSAGDGQSLAMWPVVPQLLPRSPTKMRGKQWKELCNPQGATKQILGVSVPTKEQVLAPNVCTSIRHLLFRWPTFPQTSQLLSGKLGPKSMAFETPGGQVEAATNKDVKKQCEKLKL